MYAIQLGSVAPFDPADSTEYIVGTHGVAPRGDWNAIGAGQMPLAGTIVAAFVQVNVLGTPASAEVVTMQVSPDLNTPGSEETIDVAAAWNISNRYFNDALMSVSIAAGGGTGGRAGLVFTTPAWVTNPTQVTITGTIYVDDVAEAVEVASLVSDQIVDAAAIAAGAAAILTNDSDISALVAEQLTQDSSVSANLAAILTNDSDISADLVATTAAQSDANAALAAILTNDSDISALVAEQLTQDSSVSANLAAILTNDSDISANLASQLSDDLIAVAAISAHLADAVAAHAATAIVSTPAGALVAIELQAAVDELQADITALDLDPAEITALNALLAETFFTAAEVAAIRSSIATALSGPGATARD